MSTRVRELEDRLLLPLHKVGLPFWTLVGVLGVIILFGFVAYAIQIKDGLLATGLHDRIFCGSYIAMFEFFLGVGMAGTFVSAALRVTRTSWRAPVTRAAEIMTFSALIVALMFIFLDVGRPDRMHHFVFYGRWESPLLWDVFGLNTYLFGTWIYLYLDLVPDLGLARDRLGVLVRKPRQLVFFIGAIGWTGDQRQIQALESTRALMSAVMVPVSIGMVAVASWIFAMTLREPWNSPLFGVFFVGGAAYSGIGLLVLLMAALRRIYRLERDITSKPFINLGYIMAGLAVILAFFNVSELFVAGYKLEGDAPFNIFQSLHGNLAPIFWVYIWGGLVLPFAIIAFPRTRTIAGIVVASILANIGMILERYFVVVSGQRVPLNPYEAADYWPSWVEWALTLAGFALFIFVIAILMKLVPPISIWEMKQQRNLDADWEGQPL